MKIKILISAVMLVALFASQAFAVPDLLCNGSVVNPAVGDYDDVLINGGGKVKFTILFEETNWDNANTFGFYDDLGVGSNLTTIFDDNEGVGTDKYVDLPAGQLGLWLHNDVNDDGFFNNDDVLLFSERSLTIHPSGAGSDYQWFRAFNTFGSGYADYEFGSLNFSGDFISLWMIDDNHVTNGNQDHNDMIVAVSAVPEPTTMLLLGLGLAGAGLIRRRQNK